MNPEEFAERLLAWFERHGRKSLPWQQNPTPVPGMGVRGDAAADAGRHRDSVLRALHGAISRRCEALAAAPLDEVLHLWTGLGYYARARNLHAPAPRCSSRNTAANFRGRSRCGRRRCPASDGRPPGRFWRCRAGSGIRYSTATPSGCWRGCSGSPAIRALPPCSKQLWHQADACTPRERRRRTRRPSWIWERRVCTRTRPACTVCPMSEVCVAAREGRQAELPGAQATPRAQGARGHAADRRERAGKPAGGPARAPPGAAASGEAYGRRRNSRASPRRSNGAGANSASAEVTQHLAPIDHAFTHFDLRLNPLRVRCQPYARRQRGR